MSHARHAIVADQLFDGTDLRPDHAIVIDGDRITAVMPSARIPTDMNVTRLKHGQILAPGYVDLQVNGGGGVMFNDAPTEAGVAAIVAAHRALGTTSLLPTLISGSEHQMRAALSLAPVDGALGVHVEGPFLHPQRRGIHPSDRIRTLTEADIALLCEGRPGVRLVTLAPDRVLPGTIARLKNAGWIVFAGHSEADWGQMAAAAKEGLRGVTHLFNAMSQITPRAPGLVGAALALPALMAGLILDGRHVHAANARLAFTCLGPTRLFLVSDAMATVGSNHTSVRLGDTEITLRDGHLTAADGTLGGAHLCLAQAVRNAVRWMGVTIADALRMATATPADCVGLKDRGRLKAGTRADLLALDQNLDIRNVWVNGQQIMVPLV